MAEEEVRKVKQATEDSKMTYKKLFIGQMIFTMALAFFVAYSKRGLILEMLGWFSSRWNNIKSFISWIFMLYMKVTQLISNLWGLGNIWNYAIVTVVFLGLLVGLFFVIKILIELLKELTEDIRSKCLDLTFKDIVSADIVLISLYISLFSFDFIKSIVFFNILSVWLILSFAGILVWYIKEIIMTMKEKI